MPKNIRNGAIKMNAIIVPDFSKNSLNPLLCNRRIHELPVVGVPIEQHIRKYLKHAGICDIGICTDFSISNLLSLADADGVLAINNNLITSTDINEVISFHQKNLCDITIVLCHNDNPYTPCKDFLPAEIRKESEGIYIFSKNALDTLSSSASSLCGDKIFYEAISKNLKVLGYMTESDSITISNPEDYMHCHNKILSGHLIAHMSATQVKDGLWIEPNVHLESGVKIETPVYISSGCSIDFGAKIGGGTFIGKNCSIKSGATLTHSIIGAGCHISENSSVSGGILDSNVILGKNSVVMDSAIIGSGCRIEAECTINSGVRVWPNKRILQGTKLNDNLIWGSVGTERLFYSDKICGEINVDITPDFMAKLGCAISTMYRGYKVGLSFDSAPICSILASAAMSGFASTGTRVLNFGEQSLASARLATRFFNVEITMHICQASTYGGSCPELVLIERNGAYLSGSNQQKLESIFSGNVFLRTDTKKLYDTINLEQYRFFYIQEILNELKSKRFSKNVELRTRSETLSEILENLFCEIENAGQRNVSPEFSADICQNGQGLTLYTNNGQRISESTLLYIISIVLIKHFNCKKIVLPIYASSALENLLIKENITIIRCGMSDTEFINTLLNNNLYYQFRMCFDGIYCAVMLLDYLNLNNLSFDNIINSLPVECRLETEVECPSSRKGQIIGNLNSKYSGSKIYMTDGIKIYKNNGWVLVIPEKYRHYVKIITEGINTEAAKEISAEFTNKIKKLAKLQ